MLVTLISLSLPDALARRFLSCAGASGRSGLAARAIRQELDRRERRLEAACRKANKLVKVNAEMSDWEKLNEADEN